MSYESELARRLLEKLVNRVGHRYYVSAVDCSFPLLVQYLLSLGCNHLSAEHLKPGQEVVCLWFDPNDKDTTIIRYKLVAQVSQRFMALRTNVERFFEMVLSGHKVSFVSARNLGHHWTAVSPIHRDGYKSVISETHMLEQSVKTNKIYLILPEPD
jgi:hypothetical protein